MARTIGRYEVISELGRGGFGNVYRAQDPTVGRPVAIKVLAAEGDAGMLTRFRGEATASGRLRHPNIITVYDVGEQDGSPYIVMELLEGQDLQRVIESRVTLSMLDKTQIMTQIAAGLRHAHVSGIIHRDVKPANVMLLGDGTVKIMDFGIALITQSTQSRLTPRGAMIGTFRYMAPEQFRGADPDARSDIFSYGLVFYELLSGIHPFHAVDAAAQMYNILSVEPVPVGQMCSDCPAELDVVVARLLQKDPDLRYQNFDDVLFDIEPALIKLRQARAGELLEQARAAKEANRYETAQGLIRQVLELAPAYQDARNFQIELRRVQIRPKIEDLLRKGREALAIGKPTEAVQRIESAIRLDPTAPEIRALMEEARSAAEKLREASRLATEADKILRAGDPASAVRMARQALDLAPTEARAQRILADAESRLADEQRNAQLVDDLARAERLIGIKSWKDASDVIQKLGLEFPGNVEVDSVSERLRSGWAKEEEERLLASGLATARALIKQGDLEGALATLEALAAHNPESVDGAGMLHFVRGELETKARRDFVKESLESARRAAASREFSRAIKILDSALSRYNADPDLQRERRGIVAEQREAERRASLDQAIAKATELRSQGRFQEALQALDAFLVSHGLDTALSELRDAIRSEEEAARRAAELRDFIQRANELLGKGRAAEATSFLAASPEQFRNHPEVTKLLGAAEQQQQEQIKQRAQQEAAGRDAISEALLLSEQWSFAEAFQVLDTFQKKYGAYFPSEEARKKVQSAETEARRAEDDLRRQAAMLLEIDAAQATALLSAAPAQLRARADIRNLEQAAARRSLVDEVRQLAAGRRFKEALAALDRGIAQFPHQPQLIAERATIAEAHAREGREQLVRELTARVRALVGSREYEEAGRLVAAALAKEPAVAEQLLPLRNEIETAQAQWVAEREEQARRRDLLAEVERLCARQEFDEALRKLSHADSDKTGEIAVARDRVTGLLAEARGMQAAQAVQTAAALRQRDARSALKGLEELPEPVRVRPEIQQAMQECRAAMADAAAEAKRRDLMAEVERLCARQEFDEALRKLSHADSDKTGEMAVVRERVAARLEEARGMQAAQAVQTAAALRQRDPRSALKGLEELPEPLRVRPEIQQARQECRAAIEEAALEAKRRDLLAEVERLCARQEFDEALRKLSLADSDKTSEIAAVRERVTARREQARGMQAAQAIQTAAALRQRDARSAIKVLEELPEPVRVRPEIQQAMQECRAAMAEADRREALAEIENLYAAGKIAKARAAHKKAVDRFGITAETDELLSRINAPHTETPGRKMLWAGIGLASIAVVAALWTVSHRTPPPVPAPAGLVPTEIRTDPQGASVQAGDHTCTTPNCRFDLPPGNYNVQARLDGYEPVQATLAVEPGRNLAALDLSLRPIAPPPLAGAATGTLVVNAGAPNALVIVDNIPRDRTDANGRFNSPVAAGAHTVRIQKTGYADPREQRVNVAVNDTRTLSFTLAPQNAKVELRGAPAGVEVRANGALIGTTDGTPLFSVSVRPGAQTLRITGGGANREMEQTLDPGQTLPLDWASIAPARGPTPPPPPPPAVDVAEQDWEVARQATDPAQVQAYIDKYPRRHTVEAQTLLEALTWSRTNLNDAQSLRSYATRFPAGAHLRDAQSRIADLDWAAVDKKNAQALRSFQEQHSDSPHRAEAQVLIDQIEKQLADSERSTQERAKQATKGQAQAQAQAQAVLDVITQFNAAFESRQPNRVRLIWPGAGKEYLDAMNQPGATFAVSLQPSGDPLIAGDAASVQCTMTSATTLRGKRTQSQKAVKVTLRNSGGRWTIVDPFGAN